MRGKAYAIFLRLMSYSSVLSGSIQDSARNPNNAAGKGAIPGTTVVQEEIAEATITLGMLSQFLEAYHRDFRRFILES